MEKYLEDAGYKCLQMETLLDDIEYKCLKAVSKTLNEETDLTEERVKSLKELVNIAGAVESLKSYWKIDNLAIPVNKLKPLPWWAWVPQSIISSVAIIIALLT